MNAFRKEKEKSKLGLALKADGIVPEAPIVGAAATFLFRESGKNGWKDTQPRRQMA